MLFERREKGGLVDLQRRMDRHEVRSGQVLVGSAPAGESSLASEG